MKTLQFIKAKNIITFLVLLFAFSSDLLAQPQYYNYNNVGTSSNSFPFGQNAGKRVQWLLLAGDLNQPGPVPPGNQITKLYFFITTGGTRTYTDITIKLGQTSITTLPTSAWYTGTLDTVYYRASVSLTGPTNGWMVITLDTPFPYDPTQGLVIDVNQCLSTGSGISVRQNGLTNNRRSWSSTSTGCPFVWGGQGADIVNFGVDVQPVVCNYVWSAQTSGTTQLLYSVKAVSNLIGWAGGASATVRRTTDGGTTWTNGNPNPGVINGAIYAIDAIDANNAWCTTSPSATYIYRTTNGGTNWTQVFSQSGGFINGIQFIDVNTGFAQGDPVSARWSLWKSTNGGANWDSSGMYLPQAGSEAGWNNSVFAMGNNLWFGTSNTRVYYSTNFGSNWLFGATTGLVNSYNIHFNSTTLGLAGGTTILRTTNGGVNYSSIGTPPGSGNINGIEGSGSNFWYVRGTSVYRSTNNGDNWASAYTATGTLNDIDFAIVAGCPEGWAVGSTGVIIKMINAVGIGNNNNQIPNAYKLEQNYPNPFNPSTSISFSIPSAGKVELKVFDALGRETAVLVNEFRQAGNYSIEFDASALSSGVYFYKLVSGNFSDVKKMILLK